MDEETQMRLAAEQDRAPHPTHNWHSGDFGTVCVRCGCSMYSLINEVRERAIEPCKGRRRSPQETME